MEPRMVSRNSSIKTASDMRLRLTTDYIVVIVVTVFIALIHALWVAHYMAFVNGWNEWDVALDGRLGTRFHGLLTYARLHISMATLLVVSCVGLWSRKALGFCISMLALLLILVGYVWWYFDSLAVLRAYHARSFLDYSVSYIQHIGWMYKATWWNVVMLTVPAALFFWHVQTLPNALALLKISRREH